MAKRWTLSLAVLCCAVSIGLGQQLEMNTLGGALTSNGIVPFPGSPFVVGPNNAMNLEMKGAPTTPYALYLGSLATTSLPISSISQFVDLDLNAPLYVIGDAIGFSGFFPPQLFVTNTLGLSEWSFPLSAIAVGSKFAFQAILIDPALPSPSLNITAAAEFDVVNALVLEGSDVDTYIFSSGPQSIYGQAFTAMDVSTSGWLRFGAGSTTPEFGALQNVFLAGTTGGTTIAAPTIAPLWAAMLFDQTINARVEVREPAPGIVQIDWIDGQPLSASSAGSLGTFSCTLDLGCNLITFDYTGLNTSVLPTPGPSPVPGLDSFLIGITDGNSLTGSVTYDLDLVTAGSVNVFTSSGPKSIFQDFSSFGLHSEAVDVQGLVLNFFDNNGAGEFYLL